MARDITFAETAFEFASRFGRFVDSAPTPYHVCRELGARLASSGFVRIHEGQAWQKQLVRGGKYYYTRNASTLVAFCVGQKYMPGNGFKIVGAHTDSPALKLKPISKRADKLGYLQVGVETYGGLLLHTWLDRDLGLAGRVVVRGDKEDFVNRLVHLDRAILRVPSLCVHLQTGEERAALKLNAEEHITAVLGLSSSAPKPATAAVQADAAIKAEVSDRLAPQLLAALARELNVPESSIVDFDLTLCDTQRAQVGGIQHELLFSPRLDNQMHCFTSLEALLQVDLTLDEGISMVALYDHEEIGSVSAQGAGSTVTKEALERIHAAFSDNAELYKIALQRSLLVSADGAHAVHPNYAGKHETCHQPKLNAGTVIKTNQNQRYATSGTTGFLLREIARRAQVPIQEFVVRQDSPCGSTIGPQLSALLGMRTVDLGVPQLSMHSIRETCGVEDLHSNAKLLHAFFEQVLKLDASLREEELAGGEVDLRKV